MLHSIDVFVYYNREIHVAAFSNIKITKRIYKKGCAEYKEKGRHRKWCNLNVKFNDMVEPF